MNDTKHTIISGPNALTLSIAFFDRGKDTTHPISFSMDSKRGEYLVKVVLDGLLHDEEYIGRNFKFCGYIDQGTLEGVEATVYKIHGEYNSETRKGWITADTN